MNGRLFTVASLLSLALCFASLLFWIATAIRPIAYAATWDYYANAKQMSPDFQRNWTLEVAHGVLSLQRVQHHSARPGHPIVFVARGYPLRYSLLPAKFGFSLYSRYDPRHSFPGLSYLQISFPLWAVAIAAGILPLLFIRKRLGERSPGGTLCRHCGYDLRASTDRCPECGTPIHPREGHPA